ncbi:hypothetical protein PVAP13_1NG043800 [Panicum virgatum]|uniref:rRNA N-glycosylase n=1 Tax=Panicum virgatum TaxID=38727 RepID=A0A8T0WLM2_PANVG|nr:hypothetical protein PVAP13_1NG043800 [Panicum virgatum]
MCFVHVQAPAYEWRMYMDPQQMAASYMALMQWIVTVAVFQQAADDNNGVPQEVTQEVDGNQYTFGLTAESGFFRVVVIPPPELTDQQQTLHLIFSCRDLYLVGFVHNDQWVVFEDARLVGSGHLQHPQAYRRLPFGGSYIDAHFNSVRIGAWELYLSYDSLVNYPNRPRQELLAAVHRFIVAISEACRFPEWRSHVQLLLNNGMAEPADGTREFSQLFKKWSITSKRARQGAARFEVRAGDEFPTFERLVQNLHTGVALSRPPANEL